jgi:hypothetical protein
MAHEYVFGLVGPTCSGGARKVWNELLTKEGIDGFFDFYRAIGTHDLVARLSEMFLLERRGYLIHASLQADAVGLMDYLAPSVTDGRVDTVKNERGVLTGHFLGDDMKQILRLWMT